MNQKGNGLIIIVVIGTLVIFGLFGIYYIENKNLQINTQPLSVTPTFIPQPTIIPITIPTNDQTSNNLDPLLADLKIWTNSAINWEKPKTNQKEYSWDTYLTGTSIHGTIPQSKGVLSIFDTNYLKNNGWQYNINLAANGPGGQAEGYTKRIGNLQQTVMISYQSYAPLHGTAPSDPRVNNPSDVDIFLSDPYPMPFK